MLDGCRCMFEIEHMFMKNDNPVGIIGYNKVNIVRRYNFGLCVLAEHIEKKEEREKVE